MAACFPAEAGGSPSKPASPRGGRPAAAALERHLSAGPNKHEHGGLVGVLAEHGAQVWALSALRGQHCLSGMNCIGPRRGSLSVVNSSLLPRQHCLPQTETLLLLLGGRCYVIAGRVLLMKGGRHQTEAVGLQVMVLAAGGSNAMGIEALAEQVEQQVGPPHNYSTATPGEQQAPPADASSVPTQPQPASAVEAEAMQERRSSAAPAMQLQPPASVLPSPQVELLAAAPKRALLQQLMPALTAALAEVQTCPRELSVGRVAEQLLQVRGPIAFMHCTF